MKKAPQIAPSILVKALMTGILHLFIFLPLKSQPYFNSFRFENPKERVVSIPFKASQNLILLPLFLNNSDTLWFILDSGVRNTILFDLPDKDSLQMIGSRQLRIGGLGMGAMVNVLHTYNNTIRLPGIRGSHQDVLVVKDSSFSIKSILGSPIHGIIGYALFKDFIVEINYPKRLVRLHLPDQFRSHGKGRPLDFQVIDQKPFLPVTVTFPDGEILLYRLLLDTGAGFSAALFLTEEERARLKAPTVYGTLGFGLNGYLRGHLIKAREIRLGPYTISHPILAIPDSLAVQPHLLSHDHQGIIGMDIIKRFHCYISYPDERVWLRKNRLFSAPFQYNSSGIEVEKPIENLPLYLVREVRPGSAAWKAGLRKGDQLIRINGRDVKSLGLNGLNRLLSSKAGKKLSIEIRRGNQDILFRFRIPEEL